MQLRVQLGYAIGSELKAVLRRKKVMSDGYVYMEVRKGMCGLPQAGLLAHQLLEKRSEKHGYKSMDTHKANKRQVGGSTSGGQFAFP